MKLMIEELDNKDSFKAHGYRVGARGAYKEFKSRDNLNDIVVFVYDDSRIRYDAGDPSLTAALISGKDSVKSYRTERDLDKIDKYVTDFMYEYGLLDDGLEGDAFEDEEDFED
jgi:hypothetical protein